jgi:hypothetical protein
VDSGDARRGARWLRRLLPAARAGGRARAPRSGAPSAPPAPAEPDATTAAAAAARVWGPGGRPQFLEWRAAAPAVEDDGDAEPLPPLPPAAQRTSSNVSTDAEVHGLVRPRPFDGMAASAAAEAVGAEGAAGVAAAARGCAAPEAVAAAARRRPCIEWREA